MKQENTRAAWRRSFRVLLGAAMLLPATTATAGIHTWDVVEVYSNVDGTIQYVELLDRGSLNPLLGAEVGVGSSSISSSLTAFSWTGSVSAPTNTRSFLIATAAFAALPGAPVPDVIIPPANTPFFDTAGDTVTFAAVDSLAFGAVPTDGINSLTELTAGGGTVSGANTPRNYAGVQGSVAPVVAVPSWSIPMIVMAMLLMLTVGSWSLRRRYFVRL